MASKIFLFLFYLIAARHMDPNQFGVMAIAIALSQLIVLPLLDMGTELLVSQRSANKDYTAFISAVRFKILILWPIGIVLIISGKIIFKLSLFLLLIVLVWAIARSLETTMLSHWRGQKKISRNEIILLLQEALHSFYY